MTTKTIIQKSKIVCPKCGAIYNKGKLEGYYTTAVYRWLQKGYVEELCHNCKMTTEQKTLEVKICRACNRHRENDKPINKQLDKYNLNFVLVKQAQCEVCKVEEEKRLFGWPVGEPTEL